MKRIIVVLAAAGILAAAGFPATAGQLTSRSDDAGQHAPDGGDAVARTAAHRGATDDRVPRHRGGRPSSPVYLALGDSLAAGVGASAPARTGYVALLHQELADGSRCGRGWARRCRLALRNLAVPGATTDTLITGQLDRAVRLLEDRNGNRRPIDDVAYVTVDIGGNDAFSLFQPCSDGIDPDCARAVESTLADVAADYHVILGALRTAAGPDTPIAVMTYYNPLPGCSLEQYVSLADLVLEGGGPLAAGLNDVIRDVAAQYDVRVAETYEAITADELTGDCLHTNDAGHETLAEAYAAVLP